MSVASEIQRISNAKASLKTSINAKTDQQHQITNETIDEYADFVDSITSGGGVDLSDYFLPTISNGSSSKGGYADMVKKIPSNTTVDGTSLNYAFGSFLGTTVPLINTSNVQNMSYMFYNCVNLIEVPLFDTSSCTNAGNMFNGCTNLTTVPVFDTSKLTRLNMFSNCPNLTDTSLDNILQMCINCNPSTSSTRKKLSDVGLTATNYPATRIQALPHYQAFINAGWTIGY